MFLKFLAEDMILHAKQERGELPKGPHEERQFLSFMMETVTRENVGRGGEAFLPYSMEDSNFGRSIEDVVAEEQDKANTDHEDYEIDVEIALEGAIRKEGLQELKKQINRART